MALEPVFIDGMCVCACVRASAVTLILDSLFAANTELFRIKSWQ